MPNDYYNDGPEQESPSEQSSPGEEKDPRDSKTALLPRSILAGKEFEPGDEVVLKIVAMHDDEIEVEYAGDSGDKKDSSSDGKPEMAASSSDGGGMSSFME